MPRIDTERLTLLPATATLVRADLEGPVALERALGIAVPPGWPPDLYDADAMRWTLAEIEKRPHDRDWTQYYIVRRQVDDAPELLIGVGGFKGPPDEFAHVELGYGILAPHRRRGYASEAVRGMVAFAFLTPAVQRVVAHTLSTLAPSIGVLLKCGFVFIGEGEDPGAPPGATVVRYELARAELARGT